MKLTERKVKSHSLSFSFWDRQLGSIRRAGCCGSAWVLFKVRKTDFRVLEINEAALPSASNCLLSRFFSCGPVEIDLGVVWLKRSSLGWADTVMTSRECFGRFVRCYIYPSQADGFASSLGTLLTPVKYVSLLHSILRGGQSLLGCSMHIGFRISLRRTVIFPCKQ